MPNVLKTTFGYADTDFTRQYNWEVAESIQPETLKAGVLAINQSLANGTAGGLSTFFLSDEGDNFVTIVSGQLEETDKTVLNLTDDDDEEEEEDDA